MENKRAVTAFRKQIDVVSKHFIEMQDILNSITYNPESINWGHVSAMACISGKSEDILAVLKHLKGE